MLLGSALLAYTFGLRHAVDADHIAAIDNSTRKLMQEGQRPVAVGLFFSLGHSAVVVLMSVAVGFAAPPITTRFEDFKAVGGIVGTSASALFLFLLAAVQHVVLVSVWRTFQRASGAASRYRDEDFDLLLNSRGFLARLFRPLFGMVAKSWHMFPLGFLFGLGFDTATEVALLGISATAGGQRRLVWHAAGLSRAVHRGHVAGRHRRRRPDARRLWLGLYQADAQALLQPDHHRGLGARRRC